MDRLKPYLTKNYHVICLVSVFFLTFPFFAAAEVPSAVSLTSPSSATTGASPTFTWSEATGATWYKLFVQSNTQSYKFVQWYEIVDSYTKYPETSCTNGSCSVTISESLPSDNYTWYIMGWNNDGNGAWSNGKSFTVLGSDRAPSESVLISPINITKGASPKLTWQEDSVATWYKVYVIDTSGDKFVQWYEIDDNYTKWPDATCSDSKCSVTVDTTLDLENQTWYVRGWNSYGNGDWSPASAFSVTDQEVVYVTTTSSDYVAVGASTDGELLAVEADGAKNVYTREGETAVIYASNSLPSKGEIDGTVVVFENYSSLTVDVGFVESDGSVSYSRDVPLPQDASSYIETQSTQGSDGKSPKEITDSTFDDIQAGAQSVSKFFCILQNANAPTGVDLSLATLGCSSKLLTTTIAAVAADDVSATTDEVADIACGNNTGTTCVDDTVDDAETQETDFVTAQTELSEEITEAETELQTNPGTGVPAYSTDVSHPFVAQGLATYVTLSSTSTYEQSFVPSKSNLGSVEIELVRIEAPGLSSSDTITVEIIKSGQVLATATKEVSISDAGYYGLLTISLSSVLSLTAGDTYSFKVKTANDGSYGWLYEDPGTYTSGAAYSGGSLFTPGQSDSIDFFFKTLGY